jgi:hypothetical protein
MSSRGTIFRIAALAILLLTGAELIACEALSPATSEISGTSRDQGTDSGDALSLLLFSHCGQDAPRLWAS